MNPKKVVLIEADEIIGISSLFVGNNSFSAKVLSEIRLNTMGKSGANRKLRVIFVLFLPCKSDYPSRKERSWDWENFLLENLRFRWLFRSGISFLTRKSESFIIYRHWAKQFRQFTLFPCLLSYDSYHTESYPHWCNNGIKPQWDRKTILLLLQK